MTTLQLLKAIQEGKLDSKLLQYYGMEQVNPQTQRSLNLIGQYQQLFGEGECGLFSAPGRTEVGGNHTDHQHGRVLAASVNMDAMAVAGKIDGEILIVSEGFKIKPVSIHDLEIHEEEMNTSEALIRGVLAGFVKSGYKIGGFQAVANSTVLKGSGISSSAAFEVLVGTILSHLYNEGTVSSIEIAKIGQRAENHYFGKPSGLMDQMSCSVGGFVAIDFCDPKQPLVQQVDFDFASSGVSLCLIDTKGDHAHLSDEYGLMPQEMKLIAQHFGKSVLRDVSPEEFFANIKAVRENCKNDRAVLRAIHYFEEDARVPLEVAALQENNLKRFFELVKESGRSSYMYLQNVFSCQDIRHQELAVALALSEKTLGHEGAWRVHGGGLAGTIQAFVPNDRLQEYRRVMDQCFGEGSCHVLTIRPVGGARLL